MTADIERVTSEQVALKRRGGGQPGTIGRQRSFLASAIVLLCRAEALDQFRVDPHHAGRQPQSIGGRPFGGRFRTVGRSLPGVLDNRESVAVRRQARELHLVPVLEEDRAVEPQGSIEPRRLPASFVVGQVVRIVRRISAVAIDAARPVALGVGEIRHSVGVEAVGQIDLGRVARIAGVLVEVDAGCAVVDLKGEALGNSVLGGDVIAEPEEALQGVTGRKHADPSVPVVCR